ncbi:MAG TPA: type I restriction-modification enzyme R subunit C-terminal domain-containing protein [Thermoplasmata archaeon]
MPSLPDEARTRKDFIDKALQKAGWDPITAFIPGGSLRDGTVEEYPTASGPADYVLFSKGRPLAVVEGKKLAVSPQNVLEQAERYARTFQGGPFQFGPHRIPFAYSTNGMTFWFRDLRQSDSRSRQVSGFHPPAALDEMLGRDTERSEKWLEQSTVDLPRLRPYQKDAIVAIEEALLDGRRKMLVAMATGTGKTVTTIALLYRLLKSGYIRRVLFLVDRRALAAQAASEMAAFEPEPGLKFDRIYEVYSHRFHREDFDENLKFNPRELPAHYLTEPKPGSSFVYVCTIQRMRINLFGQPEDTFGQSGDIDEDSEAGKLDIPIHAFDCIIADECHRGYTTLEEGKWREVLDHFDAVKIGLTATPAAHTKAYFQDIVFRYDYNQAVRDGYLVDYDPVTIHSDVRMNGVFLKPGEEVQLVDTLTGKIAYDVLEDEREFDTSEIERKVTSPDSNRKIVQAYLHHALEHERVYGRFPKTIVFAVNDLPHTSHADQLVNMLRDECRRGDDFVKKITSNPNVDRPLQRIREFRNRPAPAIAVTVDMLTTGVDIPSVEALLFVRPVKSRILFEQMVGRGTRRCEDLQKSHFVVFDAVGVLDYFRNASDLIVEDPSRPPRPLRAVIQELYDNKDSLYNLQVLVRRLQRIAKEVSGEGREEFSQFIPEGDLASFARRLPDLLRGDWTGTLALLRNKAFQEILENYPRAPRTFLVALGAEDVVSSMYHFRTADGRELKPEDYLQAFERFVRKNPERIEALEILLDRPREFDTRYLAELRKKLAEQPERFTEENLRRVYRDSLADIISIIRHAAKNEPLVTAEQRVDSAMAKIRQGKTFKPIQENWLQLIRDHLVQNLLIERAYLETIPFSRHGGWNRANRDFGGRLEELLKEINLAVVE